MTIAQAFDKLLSNLRVDDTKISQRYHEITKKLNKTFRDTDSETANSIQVGSYGRYTGIKGISDLDMLYIMPNKYWDDYKTNPSSLLADVRDALLERYHGTTITYDRLVVDVEFSDFTFEVQPVFEIEEDGERCFKFPDTKCSTYYRVTKPLQEQKAMTDFKQTHGKHHRYLCKIMRAWKNNMGVGMGGLLLDTLTYDFLLEHPNYDFCGLDSFDRLCQDFFEYLKEQPQQDHYQALGSNQDVKVKHPFQTKAKKAYQITAKAIAETDAKAKHDAWIDIFGQAFPKAEEATMEKARLVNEGLLDSEEFIEDQYPVDIRYDVRINCDIERDGFRPQKLRDVLFLHRLIPHKYSLMFYIETIHVYGDYEVRWKVRNVGEEAIRRNCLRGQIISPNARGNRRHETSNFFGPHYVECYIIQHHVVVARDRIEVPIER